MPNISVNERDASNYMDQQFITIAYNGKTNGTVGGGSSLDKTVKFITADNVIYQIVQVLNGQKINKPSVDPIAPEGKEFKGWTINGTEITFPFEPTLDETAIVAKFEDETSSTVLFEGEVTFNDEGTAILMLEEPLYTEEQLKSFTTRKCKVVLGNEVIDGTCAWMASGNYMSFLCFNSYDSIDSSNMIAQIGYAQMESDTMVPIIGFKYEPLSGQTITAKIEVLSETSDYVINITENRIVEIVSSSLAESHFTIPVGDSNISVYANSDLIYSGNCSTRYVVDGTSGKETLDEGDYSYSNLSRIESDVLALAIINAIETDKEIKIELESGSAITIDSQDWHTVETIYNAQYFAGNTAMFAVLS